MVLVAWGAVLGVSSVASAATYSGTFKAEIAASTTAATMPYGSTVVLSETGLPGSTGGKVTFWVGTTTFTASASSMHLCTFSLSASTTSCTYIVALDPSTTAYKVRAHWSGSSTYAPISSSNSVPLTVDKESAPLVAMITGSTAKSTAYGSSVTLSETGVPAATGGTVTFWVGTTYASGTHLCTFALSATATSCSYTVALAPGDYGVVAHWSGTSADYTTGTSGGVALAVTKALAPNFTVQLAGSTSAASEAYGSSITLSERGLPGSTGGAVTFWTGTTYTSATHLCSFTLSTSTTSCSYTVSLMPSTTAYEVHAHWAGSSDYDTGTAETTVALTVTKAPAPTFTDKITASTSSISKPYGSTVVMSEAGLPVDEGGTVTFWTGTTYGSGTSSNLCTFTLSASSSSCDYKIGLRPSTSSYRVDAHWSGGAEYDAGTGSAVTLTVVKATAPILSARVTGSTSPMSRVYGSTLTLSETGLPPTAGGKVTFWAGSTYTTSTHLCTFTLSTSTTSCSYKVSLAPSPTPYDVSVRWAGSGTYPLTTSSPQHVALTVVKATPTLVARISASSSPASEPYGSTVTLSETGLPATAGGKVTFWAGTTSTTYDSSSTHLCTFTLSVTTTSCSYTVTLTPSSTPYDVSVHWAGAAAYTPATSFPQYVPLTVTKAPAPAFAAKVTGSTSATEAYGSSITLSEAGLPATGSGTVTFWVGTAYTSSTHLCAFTLSGSTTMCSSKVVLTPATTPYEVSVHWAGDSDYDPGTTMATVALTVTKAPAPAFSGRITGTTSATKSYGSSIDLSETGIPSVGGGTVAFWIGASYTSSTQLCTFMLSASKTACSYTVTLAPSRTPYDVLVHWSDSSDYEAGTGTAALTLEVVAAPSVAASTASASTSATASTTAAAASAALTCSVTHGTCSAANDAVNVTAFPGPGSLTVLQYSSNPELAPSFAATGRYFDVQVSSGSSFSTVALKDCSLNGGTKLYWWDPAASAWQAVSPASTPTGTPPCISAALSSSSTPTIAELTGTVFAVGTAATASVTRVYGATADATAAAEFIRTFPYSKRSCPPSRDAVLATTKTYQDALSSQFLAEDLTTGTLLTPTGSLSSVTAGVLKQEGIKAVYVVGGPLAITTAVVSALARLPAYGCGGSSPSGKITVYRITGATQYGTAEAVAEFVRTAARKSFPGAYGGVDGTGGTGRYNDTAGTGSAAPEGAVPTAILASGEEFQDAQSASVLSYRTKLPLLLTPATTLSTTAVAAVEKLGIEQVILIGGPLAVSNAVETTLVAKTGVSVLRVAGRDYADTARELARFETAGATDGLGWTTGHKILVARGNGFTDGVAGAVLENARDATTGASGSARPLLLTETATVVGKSLSTFLEVTGHTGIDGAPSKDITSMTILGGPLAVSTASVTAMRTDLSR